MEIQLQAVRFTDEFLSGQDVGQLFDLLARHEDRLPRNVIDECARRGDEMVNVLAALDVGEPAGQSELGAGAWWRQYHAVMILGMIPTAAAGDLLVRLMRRMAAAGDNNLQDWCAGYWPALFRNKPNAPISAVRELADDGKVDWYMRANAIDVVVDAASLVGEPELDVALDWVAGIMADETEDLYWRLHLGNTLLDYHRPRHRPLLEAMEKRQEGFRYSYDKDDIEEAYAEREASMASSRFDDPLQFYEPRAIELRQKRWREEDTETAVDEVLDQFDEDALNAYGGGLIDMPYIRAAPKVGRNDPCPCGSGKKYKKCCL